MMHTWYPLARSASASCQTRRSKGHGRFSTIMRTRLPGVAIVALQCALRCGIREVTGSDQVDDHLSGSMRGDQIGKFLLGRGDHHDVGRSEQLRRIIHQQAPDVRNVVEDVVAVGADEACKLDVSVEDQQFEAFADQLLSQGHDRAFAQIVSPLLEAEPEKPDTPLPARADQRERALDLYLI